MRALPARRIALGALCAVLLAGITGPTAMATDAAREHSRATSPDALLVQVGHLDTREGDLAPVVDLLNAVLTADNGQLPPAEARRLGEAAKKAVDEEAAQKAVDEEAAQGPARGAVKAPAATATPSASAAPSASASATPEADLADDPLDTVQKALDELLDLLLPEGEDADLELPSLDDVLTEVDELLDALNDSASQTSVVVTRTTASDASPSPSASAGTLPLFPGITALTPLTPLTAVLLPAS
ncbi:hypothetical protein GCM10010377_11150 [Streptomyces viridiviolaceus]|uniref:Secreted protein n=1 Tax=Streptomyces viridiviolaceus TaxID=68282 RepID=A0ABW2E8Y6_9ACTN|nr:hypothetical protein [Streptomyces viridiviolaceus]GHB23032.1 hypothetical protein GCM10010377_11150 [Streptomyces viridiviolaceus]